MEFASCRTAHRPAPAREPSFTAMHPSLQAPPPPAPAPELPPSLARELERLGALLALAEPLLIGGAGGAGKASIARALHARRPGGGAPLAFIDVGARQLSRELLARWCDGATLFLRHVDELDRGGQRLLLDALVAAEASTAQPPLQLIATSCGDLRMRVLSRRFDAALYHRLNAFPFDVAPLAERPEDTLWYAQRVLEDFGRATGRSLQLGARARAALTACSWPGNLTQLRACVLRAAGQCSSACLDALPCGDSRCLVAAPRRADAAPREAGERVPPSSVSGAAAMRRGQRGLAVERAALVDALERSGWVQAQAARRLALTIRQVSYAIRCYGIDVQRR
ncbi:hypothetical protein CKO44_11685 [Rubrivivax gelatinosus]|nr:hypothetical protein [Rubrivivax gelatinosus]